jgi:hypothetical protein
VTVICPKCKVENCLPDPLDRKTTYKCYACKAELNCGSNYNFRKVAVVMLKAWWLVPVLVWAARPIVHSAKENSFQYWIGGLFGWSPVFLLPLLFLATAFFVGEYFLHRKCTGSSPKGFRAFVLASMLGFSGFAAGIALFVRSL